MTNATLFLASRTASRPSDYPRRVPEPQFDNRRDALRRFNLTGAEFNRLRRKVPIPDDGAFFYMREMYWPVEVLVRWYAEATHDERAAGRLPLP